MGLFSSKKGNIEIILDKPNFSAGESVTGKVRLTVNREFVSKKAFVRLFAEKRSQRYNNGQSQTYNSIVFDYKFPLYNDVRQLTATNGVIEYSFDIKIPSNFNSSIPGVVGNVINTISKVTGVGYTTWYLVANINVKGSLFNIRKKIKINVA